MASILPVKILTEADCELRIKNTLEALSAPDLVEGTMELEAALMIWEQVKENILAGNTITLDSDETFGFWPSL